MNGKELRANLYLLEMTNFDAILGIDWLGSNYTTIRCFKKELVFQKLGEDEFHFSSTRVKL